MGPKVLHYTIGTIAPELRHYIAYVKAIQFYTGALRLTFRKEWTWIANPLSRSRLTGAAAWALGAFRPTEGDEGQSLT
jgi:hypothetical protein